MPGALRLGLHDIVAPVAQQGAHFLLLIADHDIEILRRNDLERVGFDVFEDCLVAEFLQQHWPVPLGGFCAAGEDDGL